MRYQPLEQLPVTVTDWFLVSVPTFVLVDSHESRTFSVSVETYMVLLVSVTVTFKSLSLISTLAVVMLT